MSSCLRERYRLEAVTSSRVDHRNNVWAKCQMLGSHGLQGGYRFINGMWLDTRSVPLCDTRKNRGERGRSPGRLALVTFEGT
jgi:hypothetical protein